MYSYRGTPIANNNNEIHGSKRILSFDLLKIVALMYIIFGWHMDDYANNILASLPGRTLVIGALGVFIFISGFTLTLSCGNIYSFSDAFQYLKKRFIRIYPLYCLALSLSFITSQLSAKQFTTGLFLLNALLNVQIPTFWFVTMLFIFYLLLPCFLFKFSQVKTLAITVLFLIIVTFIHNSTNLLDIRLVYYLPLFTLGILCAKNEALFHFIKIKAIVILSLTMLCFSSYFLDPKTGEVTRYFYVSSCLIFSVSPFLAIAELFAQKTRSTFFVKLGYAAFSMYLFHRIIFYTLLVLYTPGSDSGVVIYLLLVGFPLIYFASYRIQTFYDYIVGKTQMKIRTT